MSLKKGIIAFMGSGELTGTMVEVHKELLAGLSDTPQAVFLDTPAGFELNVDQISQRAVDYFQKRVNQSLSVAHYKSKKNISEYEASRAFQQLREADFILIGPGSPTYAVHQWRETPVPEIFAHRVENGGCLVAASAAALTLGRYVLPVYEIYKVGQDLHWVEGLNLLERFGFNLVVIPHWNNAEGGTHDTRFCYMGEARLRQLEALLPQDVMILGLDEHTACLFDLEREEAFIKGIGSVTLRQGNWERVFHKTERFPLDLFRKGAAGGERTLRESGPPAPGAEAPRVEEGFWESVKALEEAFNSGLDTHDGKEITRALLELDRLIWKSQQDLESREFISQARDTFRELIVTLGVRLESAPKNRIECMAPLVKELLDLRKRFRGEKKYEAADAIRQTLEQADVIVEDTREGSQWRLK